MNRVKPPAFFMCLFCLCLLLPLAPTACTFTIGTIYTQITGTVYGESIPLQEQGTYGSVPLADATVQCNSVSTKTDAHGHYSLQIKQQNVYNCTASFPLYQPREDALNQVQAHRLILNFGPSDHSGCIQSTTAQICQLLDLDAGTLAGTVISSIGGAPVKNAVVKCVMINPSDLTSPVGDDSDGASTTTDSDGTFKLSSLPVGPYTCLTFTNGVTRGRQIVTIAPSATTTTKTDACLRGCHPVTFHGGTVMRTLTAYAIFWLPAGHTFDPGGSDSYYESHIKQFFADLQGTQYFKLLTQYWDYQGSVQDQVTLGGSYVDETPYEHCSFSGLTCTRAAGSREDPLLDLDIQGEISRVLKANPSWSAAPTHEFFVFTGYGIQECAGGSPGEYCTYSPDDNGFCAYHSYVYGDGTETPDGQSPPYIYAYVPAPANLSLSYGCTAQDFGFYGAMPGGDANADMAIDFTSHEMFESITDPLYSPTGPPTSGWYDDAADAENSGQGEIGDICYTDFGRTGSDGGNVTLNHGDRYLVQTEWSNLTNGCSLG